MAADEDRPNTGPSRRRNRGQEAMQLDLDSNPVPRSTSCDSGKPLVAGQASFCFSKAMHYSLSEGLKWESP